MSIIFVETIRKAGVSPGFSCASCGSQCLFFAFIYHSVCMSLLHLHNLLHPIIHEPQRITLGGEAHTTATGRAQLARDRHHIMLYPRLPQLPGELHCVVMVEKSCNIHHMRLPIWSKRGGKHPLPGSPTPYSLHFWQTGSHFLWR